MNEPTIVQDLTTLVSDLRGATEAHLEDNLGAIGWTLTASQRETLNRASAIPAPYPYDFILGAIEGR